MTTSRLTKDEEKKSTSRSADKLPETKKDGPKKVEQVDDDRRNTGFRSSRIRDAESRTSETGDPSIP
jgi:hypothetical protein